MLKNISRKTALLLAAIVVFMAITGITLSTVQQNLTFSNYDEEFDAEIAKLPELLEAAETDTSESTETFNAIYQSKADSIAYMASHNAGFEATDAKMSELAKLLEVENVLVVKRDGSVAAKAQATKANFAYGRFNLLREVLSGTDNPLPVEIDLPDEDWNMRYYASKIDDDTMAVIEVSPEELDALVEDTSSLASVLSAVSVGEHGYVFAVSARDYLVTYHPDSDLLGTDVLDDGVEVSDLKDGARFRATFDGQDLYCAVTEIDSTYYIFAVPESDMASSRAVTVGIILFAFFAVMISVALYGTFVMREDAEAGKSEKEDRVVGKLVYNETVGRKTIVLAFVGLILVFGVTFYMQTLFALSSQSITNSERLAQVSATIDRNEKREEELRAQYKEWYLDKCQTAAYVIEANPELNTKADLSDLADVLQIASIYVFDGDGNMTASSTPQKSYSLSTDEDDSSYEFRTLLTGRADELVSELTTDEVTGEARQYIGVTRHDEEGYANGIVQIAVRPKRLENLLKSVQINKVLDGVKVGADGFAFAVNKDDGNTIAYYPNENLVGKTAAKAGLSETQLTDGFSNYITVGGERYYANCAETSDYFLFVTSTESELMAMRLPLTVIATLSALVCFALIYAILTLSVDALQEAEEGTGEAVAESDGRNIEVTMADGSRKRSESAVSRWLNKSFSWEEKTPEQKLATVLKWLGGVLAFVVFFAILFGEQLFDSNSVFAYILNGGWDHGLNIFSITASVMYACVAIAVAAFIRWVLRLIGKVSGARGETICRLLASVVEYGTIILMLYWCLGVLGVDTATLLASAGIITLAIGFGAQQIVNDIMSGLFIIFEGEFRVGDIIDAGGCTGTVMEIGVRTTKIKDGNDNVLVVRNSNISNVTNKTKMNSYATCDVIVPLGESLTYVENALEKGLPEIKRRVPTIMDGPFYKGVVALGEEYMTIRVVATCAEKDRGTLERTLKREMGLLLAHSGVGLFKQTFDHDTDDDDDNEPTFEERLEQAKADRFATEQKEAARDLGNEGAEGPAGPPA